MRALDGLLLASLVLAPACMLDPLVEDEVGASVHILPPGAVVPRVDDDPERVHQITVHDGLGDRTLTEAMGVVARKTGWAAGAEVSYWPFGPSPRTSAPVYILVDAAGARVDHPYLFDTMPGDPGYSPIRRIVHVPVTSRWHGHRLPTVRALDDAFELGLVQASEPAGTWFDAPVVPPGTTLEVGAGLSPAPPIEVYAGGFRVDAFVFGGERGVQPLRSGGVPTGQASVLQEGMAVAFLPAPVFQFAVPAMPAGTSANYSPLSIRIEVRLAPGVVAADEVHGDADLFTRSGSGSVTATTARVGSFTVTEQIENLPLQFEEGLP
jgi:hypothetical protein